MHCQHRSALSALSSNSDTLDSDYKGSMDGIHERTPSTDPHIRRTDWCQQFLVDTSNISVILSFQSGFASMKEHVN
jgi:hypothetical protein